MRLGELSELRILKGFSVALSFSLSGFVALL
jgi:hypothetical protein